MRRSRWSSLVTADDPYPVYQQLRSESPVLRGAPGQWLITGHAEAARALRDPRASVDVSRAERRVFLSASPGRTQRTQAPGRPAQSGQQFFGFIRADPPEHTRLRGLVSKAFTPRVVQELEPAIQGLVDELLDQVDGLGQMDIVTDFADHVPVNVICQLLGVPREDRSRVAAWAPKLARALTHPGEPGSYANHQSAFVEFREYFTAVIEDRRRSPGTDLISALTQVEEGGRLTDREVLVTIDLLLVAGSDTTVNLISNGTLALLRHPDQLQRLRDDHSLIDRAVEEMLRYDAPVHIAPRFAAESLELGGKTIERGSHMVIFLAAANRDPSVFPDPDLFDVGREDGHHLSFGGGIHYCLGAPLARLEAKVAFTTLLARHPGLELATDHVGYRDSIVWRGPTHLPVRL